MAKHVNAVIWRGVAARLVAALVCASGLPAFAQALADPTRPPGASSAEAGGQGVATGPVLQSILVSSRRAEAIISGHTVKAGDKVGDAKVVKITETEVVLREGRDVQVLKLFPNIEKQPATSRVGSKVDNRRQ